jgi:hypothetical protein
VQIAAPKSSNVRFHLLTTSFGAIASAADHKILQRDLTRSPCKPKKRPMILATFVSSIATGCPKALTQMERVVFLPIPGNKNLSHDYA